MPLYGLRCRAARASARRRRKAKGVYRGRKENTKRNEHVKRLLREGMPWKEIEAATGAKRGTVARLAAIVKAEASAE